MKIGIHHRKGSYSDGWIAYCEEKNISYKIVNAYSSDIVKDLTDCDIFMWHHHQGNPKDVLFAKQLLFSLEQAGKLVYPDWRTGWHFDDKLGQKYLLESLKLPLVPSYAFFSKKEALEWAAKYEFPAVFKLRGGAGSYNVRLVKTRKEANRIINKAFGRGFRQYDPIVDIKEKTRKLLNGEIGFKSLLKAFAHIFYPYQLEKSKGRERGYAYFQEFIPGCKEDIRVQFVGGKSYAMARKVRRNDFRASGSGKIFFDGSKLPINLIENSYKVSQALATQTLAIDWVPTSTGFLITEISYAWGIAEGELDFGYYDEQLNWKPGKINPFGWMVDELIAKLKL
ncbi:MAG: hypothetical protein K0B15_16225 [Lentimicrobium sp.]|nr:hypothetical protein [Lentimicrobium sp.]